ncbi:MAG: hypothetical protein JKY48_13955 [Flavobacteriales bacterium]|nr:hypothetical protein [Flavobacteriales bacterium]
MKRKIKQLITAVCCLAIISCKSDDDSTPTTSPPATGGNTQSFTIVANNDGVLPHYTKKIVVFGIPIYAVTAFEDAKLTHTANLMAQYLDNNEDGVIDNQLVVDKMIEKKAFMVLWKLESDLNINPPSGWEGQDLGNDETNPSFVANGRTGDYDAALEEVLHIITHVGYAGVYPTVFGEQIGTQIANAMDVARGGQFTTIPNPYPAGAWYSYDDMTCDYSCMVTEYHYWALTSILGSQENRLADIQQEWQLNTTAKVQQTDSLVYSLLTDSQYKFPTVLPDGTYRK